MTLVMILWTKYINWWAKNQQKRKVGNLRNENNRCASERFQKRSTSPEITDSMNNINHNDIPTVSEKRARITIRTKSTITPKGKMTSLTSSEAGILSSIWYQTQPLDKEWRQKGISGIMRSTIIGKEMREKTNNFSFYIIRISQKYTRGIFNFWNMKLIMSIFTKRLKVSSVGITIRKPFNSRLLFPKNFLIFEMGEIRSLKRVKLFSMIRGRIIFIIFWAWATSALARKYYFEYYQRHHNSNI